MRDVIEKLKIKSVAKIREFLLEKINLFKKPMANYHIPQNTMLKFRYIKKQGEIKYFFYYFIARYNTLLIMFKFRFYYKFLMANNRDVAKEIRCEYVDTMSKIIFSYFKSYCGRLQKLQYSELATKEDLLGYDDSTVQRTLTMTTGFFSSKANSMKNKASVFSMGKRAEVLTTSLRAPIIIPHAEQKQETKVF